MQKKLWVGLGVCTLLVCIGVAVGVGVGLGMKKSTNNNNEMIQGSSAVQDQPAAIVTAVEGQPVAPGAALTTSYLTAAEQKLILDSHNTRRAAAKLSLLTWDLSIEEFAYNYGKTLQSGGCTMKHSTWTQRSAVRFSGGSGVGENLAWSSGDLTFDRAATMWWDSEKPNYYYGPSSAQCEKSSTNAQVGHYTQMAWASTTKIACAKNKCGSATIINCNYGPAGNYVGQVPFPVASECAQGLKPQCQNPLAGCSALTGTSCALCSPTPAPVSAPTAPTAAPTPTPAPTSAPTSSSCVSNTGCTIKTLNCPVNPTIVSLTCGGAKQYSGATVTYSLQMPPTYNWDFSTYCTTCTNVVKA